MLSSPVNTNNEYKIGNGAYQISPNFSGLMAGTYSVTVKTIAGCTQMNTFTVTQPNAILATATPKNPSCNGSTDGEILIAASGGTAPYQLNCANGIVDNTLMKVTGLSAGTHLIDIIDAHDCSFSVLTTLTDPPILTATYTATTPKSVVGNSVTYSLTNTYNNYTWTIPSGASVTAGGGSTQNFVTLLFTNEGIKNINVSVNNSVGCTAMATTSTEVLPFRLVSAKVFLQACYKPATGLMDDKLRQLGYIPTAEPYSALGHTLVNSGSETIQPSVLAVTGNNAIVDWVLLQLRSSTNSADIVSTKSALLQRDGDLVDLDGVSPVKMAVPIGSSSYYVSIRQRNHLGAMTDATISLSNTSATVIDFSSSATVTYTNGLNTAQVGTTIKMLRAGNANGNNNIKSQGTGNDPASILARVGAASPSNIVNGYFMEDVNMDGQVKYQGTSNDRAVVISAVGSTTPSNIIFQQLP
jgi:hypothetical protein